MKIVFTGHRPNKLRNDYNLTSDFVLGIKRRIIEIIESIPSHVDKEIITGMALGVDQLAAMIAIELGIPFVAAIPCIGQESKWPYKSIDRYQHLISEADLVHYVTREPYNNTCMQKRNEWMIDQMTNLDDILIAVWDGTSGGTKNCIDYAIKKNKTIQYIKI